MISVILWGELPAAPKRVEVSNLNSDQAPHGCGITGLELREYALSGANCAAVRGPQ